MQSEKPETAAEDVITFTLGEGDASSICGGLTPVSVIHSEDEVTSKDDQVEVSGEDSSV